MSDADCTPGREPRSVAASFIMSLSEHVSSLSRLTSFAITFVYLQPIWARQYQRFGNKIFAWRLSETRQFGRPMSKGWPPCRVKIPCRKVWLTPTAQVPRRNAANMGYGHHRTKLSGYLRDEGTYWQSEKNLLNSNISPRVLTIYWTSVH